MSGGALREIIASFGTSFDGSGLKKGDSAINGMITKLKGFAVAAGTAFAVKEVLGFTLGLAEQAVELDHHAQALGISAQSLQMWDYAASLSGVSAEELQIGLQKLQRSAVGAGGKGGDLAAVFTKLHVSVKNSNGSYKNADELLTGVAGAIGDMTDPTLQTATAMQIFGRGGARLLPFLKQGRAGVQALKEEVAALGGGFTDDFIAKSEAMVQDSKRLEFAFLGLKVKAIGPLLPVLTHLAEGATKFVVAAGDVAKKSNVAKAALIALGVGGTIAMAPLLLSIAPIVAGFLLLEDVLTFLSGGDSLTGDLLDKYFGSGAAAKVKAFADEIGTDVMPVLKAALDIFTNGEPLDGKFEELNDYLELTLKPNSKAVFTEIVTNVRNVAAVATELIEIFKDLAKVILVLPDAALRLGGYVGKQIYETQDAQANADAKGASDQQSGVQKDWRTFSKGTLPTRDDSGSWWQQLKAQAGFGNDGSTLPNASHVPDAKELAAQNVASAPIASPASALPPEFKQTNTTQITQQFYGIDNADDAGRAAAKGAEKGVKAGVNDRAQRALVPLSGS